MAKKKEDKKTPELPEIVSCIEKARDLTLEWAVANKIDLVSINLVTPSVITPEKFAVWFFFDTDSRLNEYVANGSIDKLKENYLSSMKKFPCVKEYSERVRFFTDTTENVQRFANLQPIKVG